MTGNENETYNCMKCALTFGSKSENRAHHLEHIEQPIVRMKQLRNKNKYLVKYYMEANTTVSSICEATAHPTTPTVSSKVQNTGERQPLQCIELSQPQQQGRIENIAVPMPQQQHQEEEPQHQNMLRLEKVFEDPSVPNIQISSADNCERAQQQHQEEELQNQNGLRLENVFVEPSVPNIQINSADNCETTQQQHREEEIQNQNGLRVENVLEMPSVPNIHVNSVVAGVQFLYSSIPQSICVRNSLSPDTIETSDESTFPHFGNNMPIPISTTMIKTEKSESYDLIDALPETLNILEGSSSSSDISDGLPAYTISPAEELAKLEAFQNCQLGTSNSILLNRLEKIIGIYSEDADASMETSSEDIENTQTIADTDVVLSSCETKSVDVKPDLKLKCPKENCLGEFLNHTALDEHVKRKHKNGSLKCIKCSSVFESRDQIKQHLKRCGKTGSDVMGIPIVDFGNEETKAKWVAMGLEHFIPVCNGTEKEKYAIPILSARNALSNGDSDLSSLVPHTIFPLGPLKKIARRSDTDVGDLTETPTLRKP